MEMHWLRLVSSQAEYHSLSQETPTALNRQAGHWVQASDQRISSLCSLLASSGDFLRFLFFLFSEGKLGSDGERRRRDSGSAEWESLLATPGAGEGCWN